MWKSVTARLRDPGVLRAQLGMEAEFLFRLAPLNALGSEVVPRMVRYLGYRLGGVRTETPNIFPGLIIGGKPSNIAIGEGTFLNRNCLVEGVGRVTLGRRVQVGPQAAFLTSHHPRLSDGTVSHEPVGRDIVIGDGCWIGARSTVLPGVTIARDVVIAAGAVVTSDCTVQGGLYGGVPARLLKSPSPDYVAAHAEPVSQ